MPQRSAGEIPLLRFRSPRLDGFTARPKNRRGHLLQLNHGFDLLWEWQTRQVLPALFFGGKDLP
jgi:hypothetical protein